MIKRATIIGIDTIKKLAEEGAAELDGVTLYAASDLHGKQVVEESCSIKVAESTQKNACR